MTPFDRIGRHAFDEFVALVATEELFELARRPDRIIRAAHEIDVVRFPSCGFHGIEAIQGRLHDRPFAPSDPHPPCEADPIDAGRRAPREASRRQGPQPSRRSERRCGVPSPSSSGPTEPRVADCRGPAMRTRSATPLPLSAIPACVQERCRATVDRRQSGPLQVC